MLKTYWAKFVASFHDSETIWIARIKVALGLGFTAIQQSGIDVTAFVQDPKLQMAVQVGFAWLVLDGTLSEWARRHRATDLDPTDPPKES